MLFPLFPFFQVLSKSRVVQMNRVQRTELTTFSLPYSLDLVPSFRLVAYYFTQAPEKTTIVADSVWADVKDICKGQVLQLPLVSLLLLLLHLASSGFILLSELCIKKAHFMILT